MELYHSSIDKLNLERKDVNGFIQLANTYTVVVFDRIASSPNRKPGPNMVGTKSEF
jgi:hypothetical protein